MRINKFSTIAAICLVAAQISFSQTKKPAPKPAAPKKMLNTTSEKLSYAIGLSIAQNLKQQSFASSLNVELLNKAINDVMKNGQPLLSGDEANAIIQNFMMEQQSKAGGENEIKGKAFLAENKKRPGVIELPSGLQYEVIKEGTGEIPKETDEVTTHYHGTLITGEVFDSSVERGQPASFPVNGVIKGWVEALQLMKTGSKWKLFVPANLAYGNQGAGGKIGPGSTLIFEVELISINKK